MRPTEELKTLAARKAALRDRIADRRAQCAEAVSELVRPLEIVDRGAALWQAIPAVVKGLSIPAGFFLARRLAKGMGGAAGLIRYAPAVARVARSFLRRRSSGGPAPFLR